VLLDVDHWRVSTSDDSLIDLRISVVVTRITSVMRHFPQKPWNSRHINGAVMPGIITVLGVKPSANLSVHSRDRSRSH
jgi:hypothetical protein